MATEVSVVNASSGVQTFYSTYSAARTAASANDLIQVWADLTNEQILLKDRVDIWIAPGRVLTMNSALPLIADNDTGYTTAVTCNITGYGIFINTDASNNCIKIINGSSNVSIECDFIEGVGSPVTSGDPYKGASVLIKNITDAQRFSLVCNRVSNIYNSAIVFDNISSGTAKNAVNIKVNRIEVGIVDDVSEGPALILRATGFVEVDKINCLNNNSCLILKAGTITANILKMTKGNANHFTGPYYPALEVSGGDGTQNLILYFDEIQNIGGGDAVKVSNGIANIIGRRIYSNLGYALNLISNIVSANILCIDIISGVRCINIDNDDDQIIIDANYIEGNIGATDGVVYCNNHGKFLLRNAKIKNLRTSGTSPFSIGIYLGAMGTISMELENIIVVTSEISDTSKTIYSASSRDVKNLGLFVNKPKSDSITLKIGTEVTTGNFKYIISADIT